MRRLLNFWRLRSCYQDEFTIEYYNTLTRGVVVTRAVAHDFIDPIDLLWPKHG